MKSDFMVPYNITIIMILIFIPDMLRKPLLHTNKYKHSTIEDSSFLFYYFFISYYVHKCAHKTFCRLQTSSITSDHVNIEFNNI